MVHIYKLFFFQYIKSLMQSKINFYVGLAGFLLSQSMGIIFLYLIFEQIPLLDGWSLEQMLFIYGLSQLPRGIDHMFTDYIWDLSFVLVKRGEFDRFLLRPINPLFQIICQRFQPDAIGEILVGVILIIISIYNKVISVSFINDSILLIVIFAGALIFSSIKLFFGSLAFWMKDSFSVLKMGYDFAQFSKYPVSIYSKAVRFIISYILPFSFTAFYPASYLLGKSSFNVVYAECYIAIMLAFFSYKVFTKGINVYESSGS